MTVGKHKYKLQGMVLTLADASATLGPVFKATGALSCSGSAAILLTGYLFPHLVRDRLYMKLLLMISFSDMLGSLAFALGYMQQPELCALQGGAIIFFFRATWMWTLALSTVLLGLALILTGKLQDLVRTGLHY